MQIYATLFKIRAHTEREQCAQHSLSRRRGARRLNWIFRSCFAARKVSLGTQGEVVASALPSSSSSSPTAAENIMQFPSSLIRVWNFKRRCAKIKFDENARARSRLIGIRMQIWVLRKEVRLTQAERRCAVIELCVPTERNLFPAPAAMAAN